MERKADNKIAVLIDADNVSNKYIGYILDEVSNQGTPTYKRIYGDWTSTRLASWKDELLKHSINPIQQYSYTMGKNSTDSALIIDAMDILYSDSVDGFCIVSSDSDFTRLASRLRESGMMVIGMGEKKTPAPFIAACEKFKYLEVLASVGNESPGEQRHAPKERSETVTRRHPPTSHTNEREQLIKTLKTIVAEISDEDGWAFLGEVGNVLNRRLPDFDTRNYGAMKLTPLIESLGKFDIESRKTSNPHVTHKYIRNQVG
jgi:hypothetical protein